jgi:hypothetical protein
MSNRELAHSILDTIPENKLIYIIDILKGIKSFANDIETVEPDKIDLQMIYFSKLLGLVVKEF